MKDGERLSLDFPVSTNQSIPAEQSLFEQIQATAKDAGFEVKISLLDLSSWYGVLAENNYDLDPDALWIKEIFADDAPQLRRFKPKARGRVGKILRRSCHITVIAEERGGR